MSSMNERAPKDKFWYSLDHRRQPFWFFFQDLSWAKLHKSVKNATASAYVLQVMALCSSSETVFSDVNHAWSLRCFSST